MSSHMKSFEAGDSFTRSSSKRIKERMFSDDAESDDDFDFDETNIETPRGLKPVRDHSGNDRVASSIPKRAYRSQGGTVKVPLKDDTTTNAPKRTVSTPVSKYRTRNGTPLRQPPITGSSHDVDADEYEEASLIKNGKLISDENKYSPNFSKLKSPRRSPIRNVNFASNINSPPPNFKLAPVDFLFISNSNGKSKHGQETADSNNKDIEFDPSDDDNGDIGKEDEGLGHIIDDKLPTSNKSNGSPLERSRSTSRAQVSSFDREKNDPLRRPSNISPSSRSPSSPPSPSPDPNDVSRADILERINSTIQSIKERELKELRATSPIKRASLGEGGSPHYNRHKPHQDVADQLDFTGGEDIKEAEDIIGLDDDIDDNDQILQEIDSYLPTSPALGVAERQQRLQHNNEDSGNTELNKFPGAYERSMLAENLVVRSDTTPFSTTSSSSTSARLSNNEWLTSKWLKLNKIIGLKKLTPFEIINSSVIQDSLAISKKELANRVNFLIELENRKGLIQNRKKRKLSETKSSVKSKRQKSKGALI